MTTKPVPRGELEQRLGAAFRDVRTRQNVTLKVVAEKMGCSINTVRWHEAGARPFRTDDLVRAAQIIGVDPAELLPPAPPKKTRTRKPKNAIA